MESFLDDSVGIIIIVILLQIAAIWRIYTKAGEAGWKSLIPIYNMVVLFKICGLSPLYVLVYFLGGLIPYVGPIAILILNIYLNNSLAKSFDKGIGFTLGLIFLGPIFYMILGFGKSEYVGLKYGEN